MKTRHLSVFLGGCFCAMSVSAAAVDWRSFRDPTEGMFTLDVPRDWEVSGGLRRISALDARPQVVAQSPDGAITAFIGDWEVPPFTEPGPGLPFSPEGSWYNPGGFSPMLVMRYLPGSAFARQWLVQRAPVVGIESPQVRDARERPELVRALVELERRFPTGMLRRHDAGELRYEASWRGRPVSGYLFVHTVRSEIDTGGLRIAQWKMETFAGFLSAPGREADAAQVLGHMTGSASVDPEWARRNLQTVGETVKVVERTNQQVSGIITGSYWARQASQSRAADRFSRSIRDTQRLRDPQTGRDYERNSAAPYFWIDRGGEIVESDRPDNPDPERYRALEILPDRR